MLNGDPRSPAPSNGHALLTIDQAARRLGVTQLTVRRQIKAGKIDARRVRGKFGPEWRVMIAPGEHGSAEQPTAEDQAGTEQPSAEDRSSTGQPKADDGGTVAALVAMVGELHGQVRQLEQERFELAGRLGYFQAQLAAKDEQIKALEAPKEPAIAPAAPRWPDEPPAATDPPRPWWRFWGTG